MDSIRANTQTDNRYAIIDVETTGGDPKKNGRLTEVAIYLLEKGEIVDEFTSLINPETHIPSYIAKLTGIDDAMVENAPKFYEVAKRIVEITQDAVFVGHNVGYDYSFIQHEFKNLGYSYRRMTFDTVKMSRKLLPGHKSYSLGNLCEDLNIKIENRHRAAGDARATVELFKLLLNHISQEDIPSNAEIAHLFGSNIARMLFETLPEETGVYYLHDADANVIYIGKSSNIAKRVLTHFANHKDKKSMEMCLRAADISYEITGSELLALLLEDIEIKKHQPKYNRVQRRKSSEFGIYAAYNENGYLALTIEKKSKNGILVSQFPSVQRAKKKLYELIEKFTLCQKICGLYNTSGACFHYQIGSCKGACRGDEDPDFYNERVQQAIEYLNDISRNFFVVEQGRNPDETAFIKVEKGKLVGYGFASTQFLSGGIHELHELTTPLLDSGNSIKIVNAYLAKSKTAKTIHF